MPPALLSPFAADRPSLPPRGARPSVRPVTVCLLAAALALGGCAGTGERPPTPVARSATLADGSVRVDTENERVAELWTAAEEARAAQNDAGALENLYLALEIDPRNGLLWSRAAEIQLGNGEPAQAENFAARSNAFAGDNTALLYRNWLMIRHARDLRGDLLGVRSASKRVQQYQYR